MRGDAAPANTNIFRRYVADANSRARARSPGERRSPARTATHSIEGSTGALSLTLPAGSGKRAPSGRVAPPTAALRFPQPVAAFHRRHLAWIHRVVASVPSEP